MIGLVGATLPFRQTAFLVERMLGVQVSAASVSRLTHAAGTALVAVENAEVTEIEQTLPPVPPGPMRQQVSVDGAMVPVLGGEWREVKTMVIGALADTPSASTSGHSYLSRLTDVEDFTRIATAELHRRGTFVADLVVGVADGAIWCQHFYDHHLPRAIRVLDYPHAIEHLANAAHACWGEGSEQARAWLATQSQTLRHGLPQTVIAAVAALPVDQCADPPAALQVRDREHAYLRTRQFQMAYAEFADQGWPIASGIVESANKRVVEARLKGAGMHWKVEHVNPMLALRSALCSQTWDDRWFQLSRHRRSAKHHAPAPLAAPSSATPPPATPRRPDPIPLRPSPPHRKTIVNGRPTLEHPWKQDYRRRYGTTDRSASQHFTKT